MAPHSLYNKIINMEAQALNLYPELYHSRFVSKLVLERADRTVPSHIAYVSDLIFEDLKKNYREFLTKSEIDKFEKLQYVKRQTTYLLGRYASKMAVAKYLNEENFKAIEIKTATLEHPVVMHLSYETPEITLSHAGNIAIAIAHEPGHVLGVDIEKFDPSKLKVFQHEMTPNEIELCQDYDGDQAIIANSIWTVKESLSKAIKCGFMVPFKLLEVKEIVKVGKISFLSTFKNFAHFKCYTYLLKGYILSIVVPIKTTIVLDINTFYNKAANRN